MIFLQDYVMQPSPHFMDKGLKREPLYKQYTNKKPLAIWLCHLGAQVYLVA